MEQPIIVESGTVLVKVMEQLPVPIKYRKFLCVKFTPIELRKFSAMLIGFYYIIFLC